MGARTANAVASGVFGSDLDDPQASRSLGEDVGEFDQVIAANIEPGSEVAPEGRFNCAGRGKDEAEAFSVVGKDDLGGAKAGKGPGDPVGIVPGQRDRAGCEGRAGVGVGWEVPD